MNFGIHHSSLLPLHWYLTLAWFHQMQRLFRRGSGKGNSQSVFTWCAWKRANGGTRGPCRACKAEADPGSSGRRAVGEWLWTQTVTHQHRDWERRSRPHRANFGVYSFTCNGKMEDERRRVSHPMSRSWHISAKWTFREDIIQAPSFSKRNVKTTEVKCTTWDNSSCWCGSHHSTTQEECA